MGRRNVGKEENWDVKVGEQQIFQAGSTACAKALRQRAEDV